MLAGELGSACLLGMTVGPGCVGLDDAFRLPLSMAQLPVSTPQAPKPPT